MHQARRKVDDDARDAELFEDILLQMWCSCLSISDEAWANLDDVDLREEFHVQIPCFQSCPASFRGRMRYAVRTALGERQRASLHGEDRRELQAWKLFGLLPSLLLRPTAAEGRPGRAEL